MKDKVLFDWDKDVQNFFQWVERYCGIHKDDERCKILKTLIKEKKDIDEFVELFDGDFNNICRTVQTYIRKAEIA